MIRNPCPPHHRWAALLTDDLPPAEQADLNGHLELCPACQRTLEDCAAHPDAWAVTARSLGLPGPTRDQALRDVIDQLKLDPESDHHDHDGAELPLDFLDPSEHGGSLGRIHQYEVLEEVGRGGMGVVLKALDPGLHRVCAIKVLAPQLAVSGTARKRFTREARAAAAVQHENVVTIHAVEEFKGLPYLVMQYIAGPSVQQRIATDGPLPVADILRIGFQTAAGLAAAHAQGLIHRDVKPANILLENGVERVKLTDFSLARAIDDASVTQTGVVTGTPPFMAPEQARGEPLDHRADLFSLGSVLYAMATGRPPFRGQSLAVLRRVSEETPVPIRTLNPEVPAWLEAIVTKLMAKKPEDRYQSAGEVAALLEQCLAHVQQPTLVPLPAALARRVNFSRAKPKALAAVAAGILAVLLAAAVVMKIRTANGTLEIALDDPAATVTVDGTDIVVSGIAGVKEFRLKPGDYTVHQTRDGQPEKTEVVSIKRGEKTPLRVTFEPDAGQVGVQTSSGAPIIADLIRKGFEAERQASRDRAAVVDKTLADLMLEKQRLSATLGANHPKILEIDQKIAEIMRHSNRKPEWPATRRKPSRPESDIVTEPRRSFPTAAGEVSSAVFSADGKNLFVADWGGSINSHNFVTGQVRFTIAAGDKGGSRYLAIPPDDSYLVGVGTGSTIQFIDHGQVRQSLAGKCSPYYAVAFSADGKTLAAGGCGPDGRGGLLELWDNESGKVRTLEFADPVQSVAFPPGRSDQLAVGTGGANVRIVDVSTAKEKYRLQQPGPVRALAFSPDGQRLAASAGEGVVGLWTSPDGWRAANHRGTDVLKSHTGRVTSVQFSPDSQRLVTASQDGTARLWDVTTARSLATFAPGTDKATTAIALFTPDGKSIVTAGNDHVIRVWDVPGRSDGQTAAPTGGVPVLSDIPILGDLFRNRVEQERKQAEAAFAQAQANLQAAKAAEAKAAEGNRINQPERVIQAEAGGPILGGAFSRDGRIMVIAGKGRPTEELESGSMSVTYSGRRGQVVVSGDGMTFAAGGEGKSIDVWDLRFPKQFREFNTIPSTVNAFALSTGGKTLGVGGRTANGTDTVQLCDVDSGNTRSIEFPAPVLSLAFDPGDHTRLAVGLEKGNVQVIHAKTGKFICTTPLAGPTAHMAFSPDGKWFAATQGDSRVLLRNWNGGGVVAKIAPTAKKVTSVRFSPDGKWLATAAEDGVAALWDVPTGKLAAKFDPSAGKLYVAEFSPDGKSLVTAGEGREIRFWDLTKLEAKAPPAPQSNKGQKLNDSDLVAAVIALRLAAAEEVAKDLRSREGFALQVTVDPRTNCLVVQTTAADLPAIRKIVADLDKPPAGKPEDSRKPGEKR